MKIAVPYENGEVFQHFGHTEQFQIFDVDQKTIQDKCIVGTDGMGHGALAQFLKNHQVEVLICGGIGEGAKNGLKKCGIQIYPGAKGNVETQVQNYLNGTLFYNPETSCDHHDHGHHGGDCHHGDECSHSCH